ncbi:hypothetical protein P775_04275 [Puniceibacterium antarcticum]|uniref:Uncharacterized protein n=1 Tax=Puniceibacterium antarcticum TaxID=1206336 RepID=A0A2G8RIQ2_9RHOB|nr:HEPN domain-containing protein [Puniceibacterium antarcticum]PIL21464.1 hypothetical protein P775_04275 [Puniceibacterium antarcticum]
MTFGMHPRRWNVSIFDLYSLAAENHPTRMTAELMQIFLPNVNLEISVDAADHAEAKRLLDILKVMIYLNGVQPTITPFATSHSLNDYAGINSRSSSQLCEKLPEGMRSGITAKDSRVEGWPNELVFSVLRGNSELYSNEIDADAFTQATEAVTVWRKIETQYGKASILRAALAKAPLMPDRSSSILHIWQALETVFGKGPELSFRMSITLAELCGPVASRAETYAKAKKSYHDRSRITHGKVDFADDEQWVRAWDLLVEAIRAILHREAIPSEDDLFSDLLSR